MVVNIQEEGIEDMGYFETVDKDFLKKLTDNLKFPDGNINVGGAMVTTPDFKFGTKLQMILETAFNLVQL